VDEVVLDGDSGRSLTFSALRWREPAGAGCTYAATLAIPEGRLSAEVEEYAPWLDRFLRELADCWRGFESCKTYSSGEGQLQVSCTHDGIGSVECTVTIGQPWPPAWSFTATLQLGAAAHLQRIASDAERFFA
jgi:hypothetical protein